jgi:hypothetical protein
MTEVPQDIVDMLSEVYLPEGVEIFLNHPNRMLEYAKPVDLIAQGRTDEVRRIVRYITGSGW